MAAWTSSFGSESSSLQICFGVIGSGEAKINASTSALSSADALPPPCPARPAVFFSPTLCLRIANRMRRIGRPRPLVDANRPERAGLKHPHQFQTNHLEQRKERDDQP